MYANDYRYADSRLAGTIVMLGKTPVSVDYVDEDTGATKCRTLLTGSERTVHYSELDLRPVKLGYCNTGLGCTWLARKPMRNDWRQGLRHQSLFSDTQPVALITGKMLGRVILGQYPSFEEACAEAFNKPTAFGRNWAVEGTNLMHGVLGVVGSIIDGEAILSENFMFLQEDLGENV